ncbi:DUF6308 family protein [Streptomyces sp. NBC_00557]|uniref:DUF6308 family protein n=1 Tax=Streptomyces sp. NBC_00557 TaxID=2975776 RepID=UPI002E823A40|nr:DUF6308 family protein [Streptomyces sp. NBC_00557]WUC39590.1 DUF6308 family protein [Streptomyces sp. NBC_00557]
MTEQLLHIGGRSLTVTAAADWVTRYFDENANRHAAATRAGGVYAWPAYDRLDTGSGPNEANDGDFLAPGMLNAGPSIAGMSSLHTVRGTLERALAAVPVDLSLEAAVEQDRHRQLLGDLVRVLDPYRSLPGVQLTILSKILHRKRPLLVPLFDDNVRSCYGRWRPTPGYPMRWVRNRPDAEFFPLLAEHLVHDLATQAEVWARLAALVPAEVTPLRLLDAIAWGIGGRHPNLPSASTA